MAKARYWWTGLGHRCTDLPVIPGEKVFLSRIDRLYNPKKIFMKIIISTAFFILSTASLFSQNVGINTSNPQTSLDLNGALRNRATTIDVTVASASATHNVGYIILNGTPSMVRTLNITGVANAGTRLLVQNNSTQNCKFPLGTRDIAANMLAEYIYDGVEWKFIASSLPDMSWTNVGNYGINPASNFLGSIDNVPIPFRINNVERMRLTNTGLELISEIKPGGLAGAKGQVLQSNGDGTMAWRDAAYNNTVRFAIEALNGSITSSLASDMSFNETYNIDLAAVEINTTDQTFTIYETGLYQFDYDMMVISQTINDPATFPDFRFTLYGADPGLSHPGYTHEGFLEERNKLKSYWSKSDRGSFALHIDATTPAVYKISSEFSGNNNTYNYMRVRLRCHLISK
jgi:hypothetical protein